MMTDQQQHRASRVYKKSLKHIEYYNSTTEDFWRNIRLGWQALYGTPHDENDNAPQHSP